MGYTLDMAPVHSLSHSYVRVIYFDQLRCMCVDGGRKLEQPVRTHVDTGTSKRHRNWSFVLTVASWPPSPEALKTYWAAAVAQLCRLNWLSSVLCGKLNSPMMISAGFMWRQIILWRSKSLQGGRELRRRSQICPPAMMRSAPHIIITLKTIQEQLISHTDTIWRQYITDLMKL